MESIFADPARQEEFARRGMTVVRLLEPDQAAALREAIAETPRDSNGEPFEDCLDQSFFASDAEYRKSVDALGRAAVEAPFLALLRGYRLAASGAMIKLPGGSAMSIHRDRNVVDDPRAVIVNAWCPLVDMEDRFGNLALLPGSHRLGNIETSGVPRFYEAYGEQLKPLCVSFPLKAGEAVLFDNRVLHWSHPNARAAARPVLRSMAIPAQNRIVFYQLDTASGGRRFALIDGESESAVAYSPDDFVEGKRSAACLGYVENKNRNISLAECRAAVRIAEGLPPLGRVERTLAAIRSLVA
jgi:hypothetical protein